MVYTSKPTIILFERCSHSSTANIFIKLPTTMAQPTTIQTLHYMQQPSPLQCLYPYLTGPLAFTVQCLTIGNGIQDSFLFLDRTLTWHYQAMTPNYFFYPVTKPSLILIYCLALQYV